MIDIVLSIAAVFLMIMLGTLIRIRLISVDEFWASADRLVYWVLFPAFLFHKTSTVEITAELVQPIASIMLSGLLLCVALAWLGGRLMQFDAPAIASIVQAASRHNTYISLAIAERLLGDQGLLIATLVTALLVPVTNIAVVSSMVLIINRGQQQILKKVLVDVVRNPLIVSIALGLSANFLGWKDILLVHDITGVLGSAALPLVLLCIGASLKFSDLKASQPAMRLSGSIKFLVFPGFVILAGWFTGISAELAIIFCIYAASPTATSSFALARLMGGDYRLMATLITQQTLISFFSLPLSLYLVMYLFGAI